MAEESELGDPAKGTTFFRLPVEPIQRRDVVDVAVDRKRKPHIRVDQASPRDFHRVLRLSDSRAFRLHNERAAG